jgi:hypothetical protein
MNAQQLQKDAVKLEQIVNQPNHRDIITPKCPHGSLNKEYIALRQKILNIKNLVNKRIQKCHHCNDVHLIFLCPKSNCEICERRGHSKQICYDPAYYYNRTFLCGCNPAEVKKLRSAEKGKYGEHCCICKKSTPLYDMVNIENNRVRCGLCNLRK